MKSTPALSLSSGTLAGLYFIQKYRFLTIAQFAQCANFSLYHAGEVLRTLEHRNVVGYFGFVSIPGHGKTPKVYYLKRKGWEILRNESDFPEERIGPFVEVHQEASWTPQMYHRVRLLDLFVALEMEVYRRDQLQLAQTLISYRRVKGGLLSTRETTDYVSDLEIPENRIVPDGVFILENTATGRRGLFFLEMDMGTERIETKVSADRRATLRLKYEQYDKYLTSGRFARTYADRGDFRSFFMLLVTHGQARVENIRSAMSDLPSKLHGYYRLASFEDAKRDFLGPIWKSRAVSDTTTYPLVQLSA